MEKVDPEELINIIIPIYSKHFTHDEIKELLKFYKTPTGKKVILVMPRVMQENVAMGQRWGTELGRKVAGKEY